MASPGLRAFSRDGLSDCRCKKSLIHKILPTLLRQRAELRVTHVSLIGERAGRGVAGRLAATLPLPLLLLLLHEISRRGEAGGDRHPRPLGHVGCHQGGGGRGGGRQASQQGGGAGGDALAEASQARVEAGHGGAGEAGGEAGEAPGHPARRLQLHQPGEVGPLLLLLLGRRVSSPASIVSPCLEVVNCFQEGFRGF